MWSGNWKLHIEKQCHLFLQWLQKAAIWEEIINVECYSDLLYSVPIHTVNLRMTIMDQRVVPMCEAQAWCPVSSAPVCWASISDVDTDIFFFPAIPSKHSKVFSLQISRRCGCISCTRTMNFLQWRLQHSTSQLLQSSKETFSVKNEGFVSLPWFSPSWNIYPYGFLS